MDYLGAHVALWGLFDILGILSSRGKLGVPFDLHLHLHPVRTASRFFTDLIVLCRPAPPTFFTAVLAACVSLQEMTS